MGQEDDKLRGELIWGNERTSRVLALRPRASAKRWPMDEKSFPFLSRLMVPTK